jgi:hypothetical protein
VSLVRLRSVLGSDWGFCHTAERNLGKLADLWGESPLPDARIDAGAQIAAIKRAVEEAPKTLAWRVRSRVGERVRWYETPEEVGH